MFLIAERAIKDRWKVEAPDANKRANNTGKDQPPGFGTLVYVVDLDGTLVLSDSLFEQVVRLLIKAPHKLPALVVALFKGRAHLKATVAEHVELDSAALNYRQDMLQYLTEQKANGSRIVLATAAHIRTAKRIAEHVGIFDEVIATDGTTNLKGAEKARVLAERFPDGFIYAGDSSADLAVWRSARGAILAGASRRLASAVRNLGTPVIAEFKNGTGERGILLTWARALRVHHWSKNVLLFVPLILAHKWNDPYLLLQTTLGFLLLLAVTSSTYLINDLADLDADRHHETKRHRPIASGAVSILHAMLFALVALPASLIMAFHLNTGFGFGLGAYLLITLSYSFGMKQIPLLDTFTIAMLFTLRLIMGSALLNQPLPEWLLGFSVFLFFSLATAKRHAEIAKAPQDENTSIKGRGYVRQDAPLTLSMGVASGLMSTLVMILYLVENAFGTNTYKNPGFLWVIAICLALWIGRIWLLTHRGEMHDDPVSFALRDRTSLGLGIVVAAAFVLAL